MTLTIGILQTYSTRNKVSIVESRNFRISCFISVLVEDGSFVSVPHFAAVNSAVSVDNLVTFHCIFSN